MLEAGELIDGLASGVVRVLAIAGVLGEAWHEPEVPLDELKVRHRLIPGTTLGRPADERRHLRRVDVQSPGRGLPARLAA